MDSMVDLSKGKTDFFKEILRNITPRRILFKRLKEINFYKYKVKVKTSFKTIYVLRPNCQKFLRGEISIVRHQKTRGTEDYSSNSKHNNKGTYTKQ